MEWISVSIAFLGICIWFGLSSLAVAITDYVDHIIDSESIYEDE